jgi:hypothetical protein
MKKLFTILILLASLHSFSQDVKGSRGIFGTLYIGNNSSYGRWADTITNDTTKFNGFTRSIPTADAVYKFVNGRMGGGSGSGQRFGVSGEDATATQTRTFNQSTFDLTLTHARGYTLFGGSANPSFETYYDNVSGQAASISLSPGSYTAYSFGGGSYNSFELSSTTGGAHTFNVHQLNQDIWMRGDSIQFKPFLGRINIDSLRDGATYNINKLMGWGSGNGVVGYVTLGSNLDLTAGVLSATGGSLGVLDTLLPRLNQWDVVQDVGGTSYKAHRQIVYNVKDYGAVGDNVTDDYAAIQRAVDSCHSQGGGKVYFPNGMYAISQSIVVRVSDVSHTDTAVTVEFIGETPPEMFTNPLTDANNAKPPLTGAIIRATFLSSSAIITTNFGSGSTANFCNLVVINLGLRVRSMTGLTHVAPQGIAIDGSKFSMMTVDNVRIDTESPRDSTVMPATTAIGINFPKVNNWCQINFTNSLITGYYKAIVVGEHFKANNVELDGNYIGLNTYNETQYHPLEISQMGFWRNAYNIKLEGAGRIGITYAVFEDLTTGTDWFKSVADLWESTTTGGWSGTIGFAKTISFSGPSDLMTRIAFGGSNVTTHPIANAVQTIGYGRGLQQDLDSTSTGESYMDYKTFDGNFLRVGKVGPTYPGFNSLTANNSYISSASGDFMFETGGTKIKIGIGSFTQTQEINATGFKHSSSTFGALLGTVSGPIPGVWLGSAADAPTGGNYTLGYSSNLALLSGGSAGVHIETSNDINNGVLFDANKRLGIGFAYNGTPTASLHIRAGTASASTAPLKFTAGTILTTPEAGVLETNSGNQLYYSTSTTSASRGFVGLDRYATTATSLTLDANHSTLEVTATGQTITLPTASGIAGRVYTIKLTASGSCTINTTSSQTIDASTTYSLASQYKYVTVMSNGSNYIVIANN